MTATTDLARAARTFHALSDETRLALVVLLQDGERCVCELMESLQSAQSRLSFHLKVLKEAGIVSDRKEGRWSYYTLVPGTLSGLEELIEELSPVSAVRAVRARCC
jgi:ArsR family transcriptional regulator